MLYYNACSTEDALVKLVETVESSNNKYVLGIFMDIAGAFDNLWWPSVLHELKKYNCSVQLYRIITSYFTNRIAQITGKFGSVSKHISKGCPQGSVLGPLIWNIVFNSSMIDGVHEIAYADDKAAIIHGQSRLALERDAQSIINKMVQWCESNKMELSASKTLMLQLKGKYSCERPPTIKVGGQSIKMVKTLKYLGVDIDERLGVTTHVKRIRDNSKRVFHTMARLSKERWGLKQSTLMVIYNAVVLSSLTYGCAAWYHRTNISHKNMLSGAQRSILIRVTRAYRTVSTDTVQVLAGVLPIDL